MADDVTTIGYCEEHDTHWSSDHDDMNRCFVCVFEENERIRGAVMDVWNTRDLTLTHPKEHYWAWDRLKRLVVIPDLEGEK